MIGERKKCMQCVGREMEMESLRKASQYLRNELSSVKMYMSQCGSLKKQNDYQVSSIENLQNEILSLKKNLALLSHNKNIASSTVWDEIIYIRDRAEEFSQRERQRTKDLADKILSDASSSADAIIKSAKIEANALISQWQAKLKETENIHSYAEGLEEKVRILEREKANVEKERDSVRVQLEAQKKNLVAQNKKLQNDLESTQTAIKVKEQDVTSLRRALTSRRLSSTRPPTPSPNDALIKKLQQENLLLETKMREVENEKRLCERHNYSLRQRLESANLTHSTASLDHMMQKDIVPVTLHSIDYYLTERALDDRTIHYISIPSLIPSSNSPTPSIDNLIKLLENVFNDQGEHHSTYISLQEFFPYFLSHCEENISIMNCMDHELSQWREQYSDLRTANKFVLKFARDIIFRSLEDQSHLTLSRPTLMQLKSYLKNVERLIYRNRRTHNEEEQHPDNSREGKDTSNSSLRDKMHKPSDSSAVDVSNCVLNTASDTWTFKEEQYKDSDELRMIH